MMKLSILKAFAAAALALASIPSHAGSVVVSPLPGASQVPVDPTAKYATSPELARPPVIHRELKLREAASLLTSTEASVWRVMKVKAPKCGKEKGSQCRQLAAQCDAAKKFVKKFGGHAACSTLYVQTTVLLANDKQNILQIVGE